MAASEEVATEKTGVEDRREDTMVTVNRMSSRPLPSLIFLISMVVMSISFSVCDAENHSQLTTGHYFYDKLFFLSISVSAILYGSLCYT